MVSSDNEKIVALKNQIITKINGLIGTHNSNSSAHSTQFQSKEDKTNKSSSIPTDTGSTTKYPTVKAVEDYAVQKTSPKDISEFKTLLDNASTGDTITLTTDYIVTSNFNYIMSKDINIDGNGYTIDTNNNTFSFQSVSARTLKIENCNFINIKVVGDASAFIGNPMGSSTIIFNNCIFDKGVVKKCLFYIKTGKIKINNCLFKNISLNTEGQIIYLNRSNSEIYNTIFENNTITPIYIKNTSLQNNIIKDCVFNNNFVAVLDESAESYQNAILENNLFLQSGDTLTGCVNKNYLTTHQDISGKANTVDLSDVAISGSYDDLTNKPTIPTVPSNVSAFTNDSGYLTSHQDISGKADTSDLGTVAFSNDYTDLDNKPTIPSKTSDLTNDSNFLTTHQDISGKANISDLSTVATSGSYNDLSNKPSIPSDVSELTDTENTPFTPKSHTHTKSQITDFPTIPSASNTTPSADTTNGTVGSSSNYAKADHTHPKSNIYAEANHNHSGYLTSHQDITGKEDKSNKVTSWSSTTTDTNYPSEKLVKDSLDGKANSTHTHSNYLTTSDASSTYVAKETGKGLFSGSYNDLTNKPTIPSAYTHPATHSSSMITDTNTHNNIGNTTNTLENIITNIDSKLGSLANVDLIEVTSSLPTASASTMNKLYLIAETTGATNDNYEIYVTVRTGTSGNYTYSWEKVDTARIDLSNYLTTTNAQQTYVAKENGKGLFSGSYTDLTNKPSYTATVTSSTTGSVKIGSININGSNVDIYAKDTVYTHPNDLNTTKTSGLYKIALNEKGHVTSATSVEKSDITNLGIASTDLANGTTNGLSSNDYTTTEKNKLANLHTVATTGSYNDLTNKPSIPSITQTITDGDTTNVPSADAVQNTIDALLDNIIFQLRS